MAAIPTRTFAALVQGFAAGVQGRARVLADFSVGALLRAVGEATADLLLWLQSLVVYVLTLTRASTSRGEDLDSWMADFEFDRLGARAATGTVTFRRLGLTTAQVPIRPGTVVQTLDGSQAFTVTADPSHGGWSPQLQAYSLLPGAASLAGVPVVAVNPGIQGNVTAGLIAQIASTLEGVDTVTNPAAFTNGAEAEKDPAYRARFNRFIRSLAQGTVPAIELAIQGLGQGLRYKVRENETRDGTRLHGYVCVFVDDGTGGLSTATLELARAAVDRVRAAGVRVGVWPASPLPAAVQMIVEVGPGYDQGVVISAVTAALSVKLNGLQLGERLPFTRLADVAYDASPGVTNVRNVTLNGTTADLQPTPGQVIIAASLIVTPAV